MKSKEEEK